MVLMDFRKQSFWINLSLVNLCIVALLGFSLRTKFLFSIPFIDYRNFMSAHSHFAFGGWVGLALTTLMIFRLLPEERYRKKSYILILATIQVSSVGMLLSFPFTGYAAASIIFSTLYILSTYFFGFVFIRDILKVPQQKSVRLLSVSGIISCANRSAFLPP